MINYCKKRDKLVKKSQIKWQINKNMSQKVTNYCKKRHKLAEKSDKLVKKVTNLRKK